MSKCKSCNAEIIWVKTSKGNKMPLDAAPRKMVVLIGGEGRLDSRYDADKHGEVEGEVVTAYTAHFATCPDADKHRGK